MGTFLFYLLYPLIVVYAPWRVRARVLLRHDQEVLLVRSWFGSRYLQLPGGGVKHGESWPAAACREVYEELGIKLKEDALVEIIPCGIHWDQGVPYRTVVYACAVSTKYKPQLARELAHAGWYSQEVTRSAGHLAHAAIIKLRDTPV